MPRRDWNKRKTDKPFWEGPRVGKEVDLIGIDDLDKMNLEVIFEALENTQLLIFQYDGRDRVVAPFVVGVSSGGNALLRGYQLEGNSRSGKGAGWRVFQIRKMEVVDNHQDYFNPEEFDFDRTYPWTHRVLKML